MVFSPLLLASALLTNLLSIVQTKWTDVDIPFDIQATVTQPYRKNLPGGMGLQEDDAAISVTVGNQAIARPAPLPGDRVRVTGYIRSFPASGLTTPICTGFTVLAHGPCPQATLGDANLIKTGEYDGRLMSFEGGVRDVFRDEIDARNHLLILDCTHAGVYVALHDFGEDARRLYELVGARIRITGILGRSHSVRRLTGRVLGVRDLSAIRILTPPGNPFDAPRLTAAEERIDPSAIGQLGLRRVSGQVRAVWQNGTRVLMKTDIGSFATLTIPETGVAPKAYQLIEAVGRTETDLYTINLAHAVWKPLPGTPSPDREPILRSARQLLSDANGAFCIMPQYQGRTATLSGEVLDIGRDGALKNVISLHGEGVTLPVDASICPEALAGLTAGCRISVTGTCVLDTEIWRPYAPFPHASGFILVLTEPMDLTILAHPPWWTPQRFFIVAGSLLLLLLGIVIWNRMLDRIIKHRNRQLLREESAHLRSELKLEERTRLSIELHDSLSQLLTGVALQIDAAQLTVKSDPPAAVGYLDSARQEMQSCRENLRNCLWDLRSRIFDERHLDEAIRKTLAPHLVDTQVRIDCAIDLHLLSENSLHAVLCIVRELVINAIRHGNANLVQVTCRTKGDVLDLSVADNGTGFPLGDRPGPTQGHYGLQGIGERVNRLGGTWRIESQPGKGCTVTITGLDING